MELRLHLAIVKLAANGYSVSVASSMLEKETILSDRYLKPPYGGNSSERVKLVLGSICTFGVSTDVCRFIFVQLVN